MRAGQQVLGCPALASYQTPAHSLANFGIQLAGECVSLSLDPLTRPSLSARRDTGFPAVTSLRATKVA